MELMYECQVIIYIVKSKIKGFIFKDLLIKFYLIILISFINIKALLVLYCIYLTINKRPRVRLLAKYKNKQGSYNYRQISICIHKPD